MELLLIAVVMAVVMLLGLNWIVDRKKPDGAPKLGGWAVVIPLVFSGFPFFFLGVWCAPLFLQALLLFFALGLVYIPRRGVTIYRITSVAITAAVWSVAFGNAFLAEQQYAEWRRANPFESMTDRVPKPKPADYPTNPIDTPFWTDIETTLPQQGRYSRDRTGSLASLHDNQVRLFTHAAGFGAARMLPRIPQAEHFSPELVPIIPQGDEYDPNAASLGSIPAEKPGVFERLHGKSILSFVNPYGFGYVKSRTEVAGFRPHYFHGFPALEERWSVSRIDLVGLLKQETPAVYVSDLLPRMDQLAEAPTRKLDGFETEALAAIRSGDDLFTRGDDKNVRMVGAIRSVEQCVSCHGGKRGDLLGAFSYRVMRLENLK